MEYSVEWFIIQFRNIPSCDWVRTECIGNLKNDKATNVYGLLYNLSDDYVGCIAALRKLFRTIGRYPSEVNDSLSKTFPQNTPKGRILAALYEIKRNSK